VILTVWPFVFATTHRRARDITCPVTASATHIDMVIALFDTNVLIDYLNGIDAARGELDRYEKRAISVITWMDVMVGTTPTTENGTRIFLNSFVHIEIDDIVATRAVALRRIHRMKLPDAIVWASAQTRSMLLVTRNIKDFPGDEPDVRVPYGL